MAKTDSFFIRAALPLNATGSGSGEFNQIPIDLGSYVDALGRQILRIRNIAVQYSDQAGGTPDVAATTPAAVDFQLTTQSQTSVAVTGLDKSVVASGRLIAYNQDADAGVPSSIDDDFDVAPQHWTNGYLVGVESMYLSGKTSAAGWADDLYVSLVMECQSETLSQSAAMALALSQG